MPQDILNIMNNLPLRIQQLSDSAFRLAFDEDHLNRQFVDSSAYLLAISQLDDSFAPAKWLHSSGVTADSIVDCIKRNFAARAQSTYTRKGSGKKEPVQQVANYTQASNKMYIRLGTLPRNRLGERQASVADLLEAIVLSESSTVDEVFMSVGLSMVDVRRQLKISTAEDLETWL